MFNNKLINKKMKKIIVILSIAIFAGTVCLAQKAEVLYFKADLPCCQATACNNLETTVKSAVEANFSKGDVVFTTIKLSDPANKALIEKHQAKSQTVILVCKKNNKETVTDISNLVRSYARTNDKAEFEKELLTSIKSSLK
jgi:hypothetical protein